MKKTTISGQRNNKWRENRKSNEPPIMMNDKHIHKVEDMKLTEKDLTMFQKVSGNEKKRSSMRKKNKEKTNKWNGIRGTLCREWKLDRLSIRFHFRFQH